MRYYSEDLKQFFDTEKECRDAETIYLQELEARQREKEAYVEERKARAHEVEQAKEEYLIARNKYNDLVTKFCADYGSYHCSIKNPENLNDYLDTLFRLF